MSEKISFHFVEPLQRKILKGTGIPTSIGIDKTKTLANGRWRCIKKLSNQGINTAYDLTTMSPNLLKQQY